MPRLVVLGVVLGVTWTAALRYYMVELAGRDSHVEWVGTFVLILLPGALVGGLFGLAEHWRRDGGRRGWRWLAWSPVLFAVASLLPAGAFVRFVTTGIGGGAIGVVSVGLLLGYAISGRGPRWAHVVSGAVGGAMGVGTVASGALFDPALSATTARGAWVLVLVAGLLTVLVLACAIPHRLVVRHAVEARSARPN